MILSASFDNLEGMFSCKEVCFKKLCVFVKVSCPPAEKINKTSEYVHSHESKHKCPHLFRAFSLQHQLCDFLISLIYPLYNITFPPGA